MVPQAIWSRRERVRRSESAGGDQVVKCSSSTFAGPGLEPGGLASSVDPLALFEGVDDAYSIVAPFATDPITGTAAATGGDSLANLLPGLGEGTASSGGNLLADLLSLF